MTTFAAPATDTKAPDANKHVNYTLGMLLGVADFVQEHAYLIGRDRWLARDAIGYGTLSGLKLSFDKPAKGPRVTVTSGTALTPRGQLVCVAPAQCGYVNDWLAANSSLIPALIGSPAGSHISLYLTLCYRECPVDLVPIPGEPCRSEDELRAPSRIADDFSLELRTTPPDQAEEDLVREFGAWLQALQFGGGGPYLTADQFETALRNAIVVAPSSPPSSPLSSPVHLLFGSPLAGLKLDPALAGEYFRRAFRVWVTDLRPKVHALCSGGSGCCSAHDGDAPRNDECLLLARLDVPIVSIGSGEWRVDDLKDIAIDESRRPVVVHLRLLQELAGPAFANVGVAGITPVAAGIVGLKGGLTLQPLFGGLSVTKVDDAHIKLKFNGYLQPLPNSTFQYITKAMVNGAVVKGPIVTVDSFAADGIVLLVVSAGGALPANTIDTLQFSVEISRIG
jgi:hypothetical protein